MTIKEIIKQNKFLYVPALVLFKICRYFQGYINFLSDYAKFKRLNKNPRFSLKWKDRYPCVWDKTATTGFDRHYVLHTAWASRTVAKINPQEHVDIASSLFFAVNVSAFVPVKFYDYRPANINLSGFVPDRADLLDLPFEDNSINSLSCLHTIEHVGLGRYGDQIDPEGDIKAIKQLKRVLAKGGNLLFVVPIGKPRIQFNAHRIYSYSQIIEYFKDMELVEFSLIPEEGEEKMIINATKEMAEQQSYACGCFWFKK